MIVGHPETVNAANVCKLVFIYQGRLGSMSWSPSMDITCILLHLHKMVIYVDESCCFSLCSTQSFIKADDHLTERTHQKTRKRFLSCTILYHLLCHHMIQYERNQTGEETTTGVQLVRMLISSAFIQSLRDFLKLSQASRVYSIKINLT